MDKLYYLDLFSGIGGFALGAYWAGMKFDGHYFSEIEKYPIELYKKRFPDAIALGDITKINCNDLPAGEWIITGGFPCQDISCAGKGAGIEGKRSSLWFTYAKLIGDLRPRFAIMENVGALTHRGLDAVLASLSEIGYDAEWQDIRAEDMGAPHRRERIWIVAYPRCELREQGHSARMETNKAEWSTGKLYNKSSSERQAKMADTSSNRRAGEGQTAEAEKRLQPEPEPAGELESRPKRCGIEMADTERKRRAAGVAGQDQRKERESRKFDHGYNEKIWQGTRQRLEWWTTEPDVGRLAHGVPNRVDRLKGLGNAIVPQIAELLFRQIMPLL